MAGFQAPGSGFLDEREPGPGVMAAGGRPRVGYVLKVFPRLSQTFVLGEVLAHEQDGLPLTLFTLRPPKDEPTHPGLSRLKARVCPVPQDALSPGALRAAVRDRARKHGRDPDAEVAEAEAEPPEVAAQALRIAELAQAAGLDHLHAHFATSATATARLAARWAGASYSFTAHARDIFHAGVHREALARRLADAAFVATVSDFNARYLRSAFGPAAESVAVIRNGLDLASLPYSPPVVRPSRIVAVGRLVEKKGFEDLLDACRILADRRLAFHCEILGDGPLRGQLEARARALGLTPKRVVFRGALPWDRVFEALSRAAVLAAPCRVAADGDREGLPTVLLEAMALGTPCVATPVTGIPEVVRDGETGLLVPEAAPRALADACLRLLTDEAVALRLAAAARDLVASDYDARRTARTLADRFREAVAGRSADA